MLKGALIGIGGMGSVHYVKYEQISDVQLCAVCDVRTDMAKEKTADKNINIYSDYQKMIEQEKLDFIDICTPSYLHAEMSVFALSHGINVLCEKPMVLNTKDGKLVQDAIDKSSKIFMTAHVVRFMKPYIFLKDAITSNRLGAPIHIHFSRISNTPTWSWNNWMLNKNQSGLTPFDLNIHDVDFIQYVFGLPKSIKSAYHELDKGTDYIHSDYIYDGFVVSAEAAWYNSPVEFDASYRAVFENGYITYKDGKLTENGNIINLDANDKTEATGINITQTDGYGDEIQYFINCIKDSVKPSIVTPKSSFNSVKLIEDTICVSEKI